MNKTQELQGNARSSSRTMHEQTLPVLAWGALSHPLHRQLQAGLQCPLLVRSLSHARVRWHRRAQRSYRSCLAAAPRCSSRGRRCCWSPRRSRASVSTCCGRCCAARPPAAAPRQHSLFGLEGRLLFIMYLLCIMYFRTLLVVVLYSLQVVYFKA